MGGAEKVEMRGNIGLPETEKPGDLADVLEYKGEILYMNMVGVHEKQNWLN